MFPCVCCYCSYGTLCSCCFAYVYLDDCVHYTVRILVIVYHNSQLFSISSQIFFAFIFTYSIRFSCSSKKTSMRARARVPFCQKGRKKKNLEGVLLILLMLSKKSKGLLRRAQATAQAQGTTSKMIVQLHFQIEISNVCPFKANNL